MPESFVNFIAAQRQPLEAALARWLPRSRQPGAERLNEALHYAVFPGGKRLRPMLTLLGAQLVGGEARQALPAACAVEFLHTSSLILDDLPAMDDAALRRGCPTTHLVFGESLALLAALALLNQAYALLAQAAQKPELAAQLIAEAAHCIGANGMIGGQALDLERCAAASRNLKTTGLMRLTLTAGAISCGATAAEVAALARFGECLGQAYQACDDLLDELGDSALTGKTAWQDARHQRATFVVELGVEETRRLALTLAEEGKAALAERFGQRRETRWLAEAVELALSDVLKLELATI